MLVPGTMEVPMLALKYSGYSQSPRGPCCTCIMEALQCSGTGQVTAMQAFLLDSSRGNVTTCQGGVGMPGEDLDATKWVQGARLQEEGLLEAAQQRGEGYGRPALIRHHLHCRAGHAHAPQQRCVRPCCVMIGLPACMRLPTV